MSKLIVYQSQTGFTKRYALWIAEALHCPAKTIQSITFQELTTSELLIYGSWIMANRIQGLDNLAKKRSGHLAIFAVGASPYSEELVRTLREVNLIPHAVPLFYLQGGLRPGQLNGLQRMALERMEHVLLRKKQRTAAEEELIQTLEHGGDFADIRAIRPMIEALGPATSLWDDFLFSAHIS